MSLKPYYDGGDDGDLTLSKADRLAAVVSTELFGIPEIAAQNSQLHIQLLLERFRI